MALWLGACGATLNPELEQGIPVSQDAGSAQMRATSAPGSAFSTSATTPVALPSGAENLVTANTPGAQAYKIGPYDVLEIVVFKVPELSRAVQVGETGTVNLPLVNEIVAAGKTPQQFERELTSLLGAKYLQSPQVTVTVREFNSQRVTVEGAVKTPGVYPIKGTSTLLQMMALAGGIDTTVATNEVAVFRVRDGKRYAAKFDVGQIRTGNSPDPVLIAGDVIVVNTSDLKNGFNNFLKALPLASFLLLL